MKNYLVGTTLASGNSKVGRIPATWSGRETCPPSCPLFNKPAGKKAPPCYYFGGYRTGAQAKRLAENKNNRGLDRDQFIGWVLSLPIAQLWRDRIGGDQIPDLRIDPTAETIDQEWLDAVATANKRRRARGFGYCHYDVIDNLVNRAALVRAAAKGFVLNVSANNIAHALRIHKAAPALPIAVMVPMDYTTKDQTIDGLRIILCPNAWNSAIDCQRCQICAIGERDYAIALPAHGNAKRAADIIARSTT